MSERKKRCWSHHYITGAICQKNEGHFGPHVASADLANWYHVWTQDRAEPACNQREIFVTLPRRRGAGV